MRHIWPLYIFYLLTYLVSRGSWITGRLANLYPEHFAAFGFLALSYFAPTPNFDLQQLLTATKETVGYELFGYWEFFSEEGADKLIEKHVSTHQSYLGSVISRSHSSGAPSSMRCSRRIQSSGWRILHHQALWKPTSSMTIKQDVRLGSPRKYVDHRWHCGLSLMARFSGSSRYFQCFTQRWYGVTALLVQSYDQQISQYGRQRWIYFLVN